MPRVYDACSCVERDTGVLPKLTARHVLQSDTWTIQDKQKKEFVTRLKTKVNTSITQPQIQPKKDQPSCL